MPLKSVENSMKEFSDVEVSVEDGDCCECDPCTTFANQQNITTATWAIEKKNIIEESTASSAERLTVDVVFLGQI